MNINKSLTHSLIHSLTHSLTQRFNHSLTLQRTVHEGATVRIAITDIRTVMTITTTHIRIANPGIAVIVVAVVVVACVHY